MRRARARPRGGHVYLRMVGRGRCAVWYDDGRALVAVAQVHAARRPGLLLPGHALRHVGAQGAPAFGVFLDLGGQLHQAGDLVEITGGLGGVAHADGLALGLVAVEQRRAAPALQGRRELPAEVGRIADRGVHAEPAGGIEEVRRIAADEDVAFPVPLGHHLVAGPRLRGEHFERDLLAHRLPDLFARVLGIVVAHEVAVVGPVLLAVHRDENTAAVGRERPQQRAAPARVRLREARRAKVDAQVVCQRAAALECDAELAAHEAAPAVAADEEP